MELNIGQNLNFYVIGNNNVCHWHLCRTPEMDNIFMTYWINGHLRRVKLIIGNHFRVSLVTLDMFNKEENAVGGLLDR